MSYWRETVTGRGKNHGVVFCEEVQQVYHKTEHIQGRDIYQLEKCALCPQSHNPLTEGGVIFM